jgi:hypothetical protein
LHSQKASFPETERIPGHILPLSKPKAPQPFTILALGLGKFNTTTESRFGLYVMNSTPVGVRRAQLDEIACVGNIRQRAFDGESFPGDAALLTAAVNHGQFGDEPQNPHR